MTRYSSTKEALKNYKSNPNSSWNASGSVDLLSTNPEDGAPRMFDGLTSVIPKPPKLSFAKSDPMFTMGSCFAREIEKRFINIGGEVLSRPPVGKKRANLTRYTPRSMLQEFRRCLGEAPEWSDDLLLYDVGGIGVDLHYSVAKPGQASIADALFDRALLANTTSSVKDARIIILTLGLVESWVHIPSGWHLNSIDFRIASRSPDEFEFHLLDYPDTVRVLEDLYSLISRHHSTGQFDIVVTVSPVPLQATFSGDDILIANMRSKSILRAAADAFSLAHDNVSYFPSYEIATYSNRGIAWEKDRVHVTQPVVDHIMDLFVGSYFVPDPSNQAGILTSAHISKLIA